MLALVASLAVGAIMAFAAETPASTVWIVQACASFVAVGITAAGMSARANRRRDDIRGATDATADAQAETIRRLQEAAELDLEIERALDIVDSERALLDILRVALPRLADAYEYELHLIDPHEDRLRFAMATIDSPAEETREWTPWDSLAAREGKTIVYATTERLDICPHLQSRIDGPSSAICSPLSVMGRLLGVLYAVAQVGQPTEQMVIRVESIARKTALRVALARALHRNDEVLAVDEITGLPDRKTTNAKLARLREDGVNFSMTMIEFDHFDAYTKRHGKQQSENALRLLAEALGRGLRPNDFIGRLTENEIIVLLPQTTAHAALKVIERVREGLVLAQATRTDPVFTCSFGIAHSTMASQDEQVYTLAVDALEAARAGGRNRVMVASPLPRKGRPAHPSMGGPAD